MSVMTKLYDNYAAASRAAAEVDGLALADVETSILGNDSFRDDYSTGPYYDQDHDLTADPDASGAATGAGVGAAVGGGAGLLAGLGMLAIPGIGPLVAAGWLAATAVGVAGGAAAGGAVGALVDLGIDDDEAPVYSEAFRRGKVGLTVRFPEQSRTAVEAALSRVEGHSLMDLRGRYESDGWRVDETDAERDARIRRTTTPPTML